MIGRDGDPAPGAILTRRSGSTGGPPKASRRPKVDPANWMSVEGPLSFPALQAVTES